MYNRSVNTGKASIAKVLITLMIMISFLIFPGTETKAAAAPTLSKTSSNILIGDTYDLNVNNKAAKSSYSWTTSNKKIATVDKNGIITGVSKGTAVITCTVKTPVKTYKLTCSVTIIKPAAYFGIKNKVTALNLGQSYDVDHLLAPSTSNDKTTWKSSNKSIAAPDASGKFTALKMGSVTITGKTLGGKSDSMTIRVVDKEGTVSTQEELLSLLGSGVSLITIKTDEVVEFTIPSGNYSNTILVVDAPKSDVHNYGTFSSIDIKNIASNSWYENAVGNLLHVLASDARIVISSNSVVKIKVNEADAKLKIENEGIIEEVAVVNAAEINITGNSDDNIPITVNVPNLTLTTSIPLDLNCNQKIALTLFAGAEATKIMAASSDVIPVITGNTKIVVTVGTGNNATQQEIEPTPLPETTPDSSVGGGGFGGAGGGSGSGGSTTPTPNVTEIVNSDGSISYRLAKPYTQLSAISVSYLGENFFIDGFTLETFKLFLANDSGTIALWTATTETTNSFSGQNMTVKGSSGSATKTVTFNGGQLNGKTYLVTVGSNNSVTVTNVATSTTFTMTKIDDNTLKISANHSDITFVPSFY